MRVKTLTAVFSPAGGIVAAGVELEVEEKVAADWLARKIAEPVGSAPQPHKEREPVKPQPPIKSHTKGKR